MGKQPTTTIEGVPTTTHWRLMTLAEQRGIRVVDLLNELAVTGTISRPNVPKVPLTTRQRIALMHTRGMTAPQMAVELQITTTAVYYHLRILALIPNRAAR